MEQRHIRPRPRFSQSGFLLSVGGLNERGNVKVPVRLRRRIFVIGVSPNAEEPTSIVQPYKDT
jgi:hypothetical protein